PVEEAAPQHADVHGVDWEQWHHVEHQHDTAPNQIEGIPGCQTRGHERPWLESAPSKPNVEIDQRRDASRRQDERILWQPRSERKLPDQAMWVKDAALTPMELVPDGVEQRYVVGRWVIQVEIQAGGQELVLKQGQEQVERDNRRQHEVPE